MSKIYSEQHRVFQDRFATRKMADRLEEMIVKTSLDEMDQAFVASRDLFFLSTIDQYGFPTVSHKGGAPGFVRVLDASTLAFPSYDGNGMFFSMGNLVMNPKIGMLFIDFEKPHRLRVHGEATIDDADPLLASYPGAELVARVRVTKLWINCPRYVHRYQRVAASRYVPRADARAPLAVWKRLEAVQDVLPPQDVGRTAEEGGTLTIDQYMEKLLNGEA